MGVWHEIIIPIIFLFLILPSLFWLLLTCLFNCQDRLWIANFWKIWLKIRNKFWIYLNYILLWEYSVENEYKKNKTFERMIVKQGLNSILVSPLSIFLFFVFLHFSTCQDRFLEPFKVFPTNFTAYVLNWKPIKMTS